MKKHKKFIISSSGGSYIADLEIIHRRPWTPADMTLLDKLNGFAANKPPKWMYLVEVDVDYEPGIKEHMWLSSHYRWKK